MANFYVSVTRGSDATGDGTASAPWKSIARAIGSSPAAALDPSNPNFLYIEPGVYREGVPIGVSPTAAGPLTVVGDSDGAGFAAGGWAAPVAGLVEWRAWTTETAPSGSICVYAASGKSNVAFERVKFIGGPAEAAVVAMDATTGFAFRDCSFVGYCKSNAGTCLSIGANAGTPMDLTVERCEFTSLASGGQSVLINVPLGAADWSLGVRIVNCAFRGAGSSCGVKIVQTGGAGPFYAGGASIQNCSFYFAKYGVYAYYGPGVPSSPFAVNGCLFVGAAVHADAAGQIVEDGNVFMSPNPNENVTPGAHSLFDACPSLDFGDGRLTGLPLRPFGTPSAGSAFAGFGGFGSPPADDLTGRNRPEGAGSTAPSVGCLERHDTGARNTTYQDAGSSACLALVGPGSEERLVLLDPRPTTLSVKVRWDGNHGDVNKPQAVLIAEPQIGVPGQVLTAATAGGSGATPNAFETLTFAPFTPTGKGAAMLRLVSRSATGAGAAYFDAINLS